MLPLAILSCNTKKKNTKEAMKSVKKSTSQLTCLIKMNYSTFVVVHRLHSLKFWSVIYFHGGRLFAVTDCVVVYIEYETSNKNVSLEQTFLDKNMRIASLQCLYIILGVCKYRT